MWRFSLIPTAILFVYLLDSFYLKAVVIFIFTFLFLWLNNGGRCCGLTLRERLEQNACKTGDIDAVKTFIALKGIKTVLKIRGPQDCSILFFAIFSQNVEMIDFLIGQGFDPNQPTKLGETPLMRACVYKATNIVAYLVSHHDLNLDARHFLLKKSALVLAYERGFYEIVDTLLRAGCTVQESELVKREPNKYQNQLRVILAFHRKLRLFLKVKKLWEVSPSRLPGELESMTHLELNKLGRFYL